MWRLSYSSLLARVNTSKVRVSTGVDILKYYEFVDLCNQFKFCSSLETFEKFVRVEA